MKSILVAILEGAIVGIAMAIAVVILDIETTTFQLSMLIIVALTITSVASAISGVIKDGKEAIFYEWVYKYDETTTITVIVGFTERLYINDQLVDKSKKVKLKTVELSGKLKTGEAVKAVIIGGMTAKCELLVGGKLLQPISTKKP